MFKVFITEKIKIDSDSDSNATYTSIDGKDSTESGIQNSIINDIALVSFVRTPTTPGVAPYYAIYLPSQKPSTDEPFIKVNAAKYNITVMGV